LTLYYIGLDSTITDVHPLHVLNGIPTLSSSSLLISRQFRLLLSLNHGSPLVPSRIELEKNPNFLPKMALHKGWTCESHTSTFQGRELAKNYSIDPASKVTPFTLSISQKIPSRLLG
jgi:hypothetical protein